jgi:DNA-directed RNA polymerase subunit M/transcription elongation factor TFIIS
MPSNVENASRCVTDEVYIAIRLNDVLQRKTVYRQAQTRSADEPMTVSIPPSQFFHA